jgi:hypothetical protein
MLRGIVSGVGWFGLFLAAHIVWFHLIHVRDAFKWIVKGLAACLLGHVATMAVWNWHSTPAYRTVIDTSYGALAIACLFILYMPFYYTIVASLSIQTLICLLESPQNSLTLPELHKHFASRDIVAGRLDTMTRNGYLERVEAGYSVTPKARAMSAVFAFLKNLWKLGPGG